MKRLTKILAILIISISFTSISFTSDLNFTLGIKGYYNNTKIKYNNSEIEKTLSFTSLALGGTINLDDTFYLSFYGGINSSKFNEDIQFDKLPFSINIPNLSSSGLFFDGKFSFFPFEIKNIELGGSLRVLAIYTSDVSWDLTFPIVSGDFKTHFGLYNFIASFEGKGDISDNLQIQGGLTLLKTLGNIHGEENVADGQLSSIEDIDFSNSIYPGFTIMAKYSIEDYLEISLSANMLNTMIFSLSLNYIF